jgi:hypothetical protein
MPNLLREVSKHDCQAQVGVSVPEWHSRKTLPKEIHCTPYGSAHLIAFELEGIEG